jgi:type II secretory pathway pseudopilin PulG
MLVSRDRTAREDGFGILEIVIVVSLSVVITTMALLGFSKARARYELTQRAQNLSSQIERARSIAIKLNKTLTLGFSTDKRTFGLTCTDCPEAKDELAALTLPSNLQLSAFPTISIRGNGTVAVQGSTGTLTLSDGTGRSLLVTLNNSGRVVVGSVTDDSAGRPGHDTTSTTTTTSGTEHPQ